VFCRSSLTLTHPSLTTLISVIHRRIVKRRAALAETIKSHAMHETEESTTKAFSIPIPEITLPKEEDDPSAVGPKLYVRDDGTVDWDGALQDRSALQNFGTAVWARINGQNPEFEISGEEEEAAQDHAPKPVTVKIEETDAIRKERDALNVLQVELDEMEVVHTALLNSGTSSLSAEVPCHDTALRSHLYHSLHSTQGWSSCRQYQLGYAGTVTS
jgi:hypothetical protein